jgi:colanic acid/amylovoran biosynthesis protein
MLLAILDWLGENLPNPRFVVTPDAGPYEWRARLGLYQKLDARRAGRLGWLIERLLHGGYCSRYGLVPHEGIDVLLDASGFAYGDAWRPAWVDGGAEAIERAKEAGQKVVMLPQAFGPFTVPRVREAARRILKSADLVYARDPQSHSFVTELCSNEYEQTKVRQAPDFTNLLPGEVPNKWDRGDKLVAIIPNAKMLEHGTDEEAREYVPFICRCIDTIESCGYKPFILLHERKHDEKLASRIQGESPTPVNAVYEPDPLRIKGIISTCSFVVSSRFHGLVNALSQGVPALATSWSHKYRHLMEAYGMGRYLVGVNSDDENELKALESLIGKNERDKIARDVARFAATRKRQVESMWSQVEQLLAPEVVQCER